MALSFTDHPQMISVYEEWNSTNVRWPLLIFVIHSWDMRKLNSVI